MNTKLKKMFALAWVLVIVLALAIPVLAETAPADAEAAAEAETGADNTIGLKAIGSGLAVGIAAAGGAVGMGLVAGKSTEGISRQPEAEGKIRTAMMLGLVFIETAIIYALLVVILIIFVL